MAANSAHGEEPRNPHVHYEVGDVNARVLTKFGMAMAVMIVIFLFGLWGMFDYLIKREAEMGLPQSSSAMVNAQRQPPEPRLQRYPAREMRDLRAAQEQIAHQYALIDPDKGIVRIPVDRAMDLIVQRGLPVTPAGKTK